MERSAFLAAECGDDHDLRAAVERLLDQDQPDDAEFAPESLPDRVGGFRVLAVIGEGGMGRVYLAEQDKPRRQVAVKVLRVGLASDANRRRFEHEAEVLGRLQHRGIAQVIEFGTEAVLGESIPFLVMELIDGVPLREATSGLALRDRITTFLAVCDAVEHAHRHGVIHRDLKPENVLVANGQPKVLDFGIARVAGDANREQMTMTGQIVGTLAYMSPEQVRGEVDLDIRSDIYSLGVVLYELLSGRLPLETDRQTFVEALRIVQHEEPRPLGTVVPQCRGDLEILVGKCLAKDPERRYASVDALTADLRRFLADQPIAARSPTTWYQLRKFASRHRVPVAAGLLVVLALAAGLVGTLIYANRAERLRAEGLHDTYSAMIVAAHAAITADPHRARRSVDAAPVALRGFEWQLLTAALDQGRIWDGPAVVRSEQSAAGERLLVAVVEGQDLSIRDVSGGELVTRVPIGLDDATEPRLADGGQRVLVKSRSLPGFRVVAANGEAVRDLVDSELVRRKASLRPDGRSMVSWLRGGEVVVHDLQGGADRSLPPASVAAWTAGGSGLLTAGSGMLQLRDPVRGEQLVGRRQNGFGPSAPPVFARATPLLVLGSLSLLEVHDAASLELVERFTVDRYLLGAVGCDRTARRVAASSVEVDQGTTRLFDRERRQQLAVHLGGGLRSLGFDEETGLWFGADEHGVRPLSTTVGRGRVLGGDRTHDSFVYKASYSTDGRRIVTSGWDGRARVFDAWDGRLLASFEHGDWAASIAFLDEHTVIALDSPRKSITHHDLLTGRTTHQNDGERWPELAPVGSRAVPRDRHAGLATVVIGSGLELGPCARGLGVFERGVLVRTLLEVDSQVVAVSWLPSQCSLVVATAGGRLAHWHVSEDRRRARCRWQAIDLAGLVYAVGISPDGARVAVGLDGGTIELWDLVRGRRVVELSGHGGYVHDVEFSPDGTQLVSASGDGTVRIWDTWPLARRLRDAWGR